MRRALIVALVLVALIGACDGLYTVEVKMPYCPVSDSAKAQAESIAVACVVPKDGTVAR